MIFVGLGFRKAVTIKSFENVIHQVYHLTELPGPIKALATLDTKALDPALQEFAAAGSRQLERLRRLLQLLPECAQLTAIKASASAVILSGVAADPRSLEHLPDAIFAAFAEAEQPELAAWPVLLTGSQAADFSSTGTLPGRFVLRLAFVELQRAAKAKATAFGSDS